MIGGHGYMIMVGTHQIAEVRTGINGVRKGGEMRDFYDDGFKDGYGEKIYGDREYPISDGDRYSYEQGLEKGRRWRRYRDEEE